jgi:hypothetical protein
MSENLQPLTHYVQEAAGLTSSQFLLGNNHPVLLWSQSLDWVQADEFQFTTMIIDSDKDALLTGPAKTQSQAAKTLVIEIRKHQGSTSSKMILVGRAVNNDIIFNDLAISKLHAYFQKSEGDDSYNIIDAGSTNGTQVNRQLLTPQQRQPLANKDHIEFGPNIQVVFFTPLGFYDFLQHLHKGGIA